MSTPRWRSFYSFSNPNLQQLIRQIPRVIVASRSQNTVKVYIASFQRFERWALQFPELPIFPASPEAAALYLLSFSQSGKSTASIMQFHFGLIWVHRAACLPSPTQDPAYDTILQGVRSINAAPVTHKKPLSADMIMRMRESMRIEDGSNLLPDFCLLLYIVLSYAGFLRFDEATHIRRGDVTLHKSQLELVIPKSKTDQFRSGKSLVIARTGTPLCPVKMIRKYFYWAGISQDDNRYIFRNVFFHKNSGAYTLRQADVPMTYGTLQGSVAGYQRQPRSVWAS